MNEMRATVIRWNIERYERQLAIESDPSRRRTLLGLLAEARNEAMLASAENVLARQGKERDALAQEAHRWRVRAQEYRVISEACQSAAARHSYLTLARGYDVLAERADAFAADETVLEPKTG